MQDKLQLFIERYILPKVGEKTLEDIRLKRARTKVSKAVIESLKELDILKEMTDVEVEQLTHNILNYKALKELKKKKPKYDSPEIDLLPDVPSDEKSDEEAIEEDNPIEVEFDEEEDSTDKEELDDTEE